MADRGVTFSARTIAGWIRLTGVAVAPGLVVHRSQFAGQFAANLWSVSHLASGYACHNAIEGEAKAREFASFLAARANWRQGGRSATGIMRDGPHKTALFDAWCEVTKDMVRLTGTKSTPAPRGKRSSVKGRRATHE